MVSVFWLRHQPPPPATWQPLPWSQRSLPSPQLLTRVLPGRYYYAVRAGAERSMWRDIERARGASSSQQPPMDPAQDLADLVLARGYVDFRRTNVTPVNVYMSHVQRTSCSVSRTMGMGPLHQMVPTCALVGPFLLHVTCASPLLSRDLE